MVPGFCRDCLLPVPESTSDERCPRCGSPRLLRHPELEMLTLAHLDCDAFYAAVEKRDNPALKDKPVIVGGGRRGVAMTACYVARRFGVRSAMPMFRALALCPEAVVVSPDMRKYAEVSRQIREILQSATPLVEPASLDEAYLDLAGTEAVHHRPPAITLADLARRIEREIGVTASIGLSYNKLLAKLASEMDKPRGFGVIGRAEAVAYLAARPARAIPGVGEKLAARLAADGIVTVGDLQRLGAEGMARRFGAMGRRLAALAHGHDERSVVADRPAKSISAENTFDHDLSRLPELEAELWSLCELVARRLKRHALAGRTVVLKLKTAQFRILTRHHTLAKPTQLAEAIYKAAQPLLAREVGQRRFRLIGVGATALEAADAADTPDLFAAAAKHDVALERAMDKVREKFGDSAIRKGRSLVARPRWARAEE